MEIVKVCSSCKTSLGLCSFSKDKRKENGLRSKCKGCDKAYKEANKDKIAEYDKANQCKFAERKKSWCKENKDKVAEFKKAWQKANPAKTNAANAKRRSSKLKATPSWLTREDCKQMQAFYDQAQQLTLSTGVQHHVDHIYPLQGETVCGLHVPSNLQVLTAAENMGKSNKFTASD
jgi:hypothetical protein